VDRCIDLRDVEKKVNFGQEFHTYGLQWNENEITFYFDGREIRRETNKFCFSEVPIWLSLAIIPWAGPVTDAIDGTTMRIDWVRYYQSKER
jgi:beta-glucanase (GH16 family)